jgi:YD repeat-containing protein
MEREVSMMKSRSRNKGKWLSIAVTGVLAVCLSSATAHASNGIKYFYDALDRVTSIERDYAYKFTYKDDSNSVMHTDERLNTAVFYYDSFGDPEDKLLMEVENTGQGYTQYDYTAAGKLKSLLMHGNTGGDTKRSYAYDDCQFLECETLPEMDPISGMTVSVKYTHDPVGNVITRQDARGITSYAYDGTNCVTDITYPAGTPGVHYTYNRDHSITSMGSAGVTTYAYTYAPDHKLVNKSYTIDGKSYSVSFGYNALRNMESITYPNGRQVKYDYYPDQERVLAVRYTDSKAVPPLDRSLASNITYDATGQISGMIQGNGIRTSISFDTNCRPKTIAAPNVMNMEYLYDWCDNVLSITDYIRPANNITMGASGYDRLNRLIGAAGPWGTLGFTYFYNGNRESMTTNSTKTSYSYNANNRLSSVSGPVTRTITHDGSGNMTYNGIFNFTYNNANRMISSSDGFFYTYDGEGNRIKKARNADSWIYHYGLGKNIIAETTVGGSSLVDYIFLGDKAIAKYTW